PTRTRYLALIATVCDFGYQCPVPIWHVGLSGTGSSSMVMNAQIWTMCEGPHPTHDGTGYADVASSSNLAAYILDSFELRHVPSHFPSHFPSPLPGHRCPRPAQDLPPH